MSLHSCNSKKYSLTVFLSISLLASSFLSTEVKAATLDELFNSKKIKGWENHTREQKQNIWKGYTSNEKILKWREAGLVPDFDVAQNDLGIEYNENSLKSLRGSTRHNTRQNKAQINLYIKRAELQDFEAKALDYIRHGIIPTDEQIAQYLNLDYESAKINSPDKNIRNTEKVKKAMIDFYSRSIKVEIKKEEDINLGIVPTKDEVMEQLNLNQVEAGYYIDEVRNIVMENDKVKYIAEGTIPTSEDMKKYGGKRKEDNFIDSITTQVMLNEKTKYINDGKLPDLQEIKDRFKINSSKAKLYREQIKVGIEISRDNTGRNHENHSNSFDNNAGGAAKNIVLIQKMKGLKAQCIDSGNIPSMEYVMKEFKIDEKPAQDFIAEIKNAISEKEIKQRNNRNRNNQSQQFNQNGDNNGDTYEYDSNITGRQKTQLNLSDEIQKVLSQKPVDNQTDNEKRFLIAAEKEKNNSEFMDEIKKDPIRALMFIKPGIDPSLIEHAINSIDLDNKNVINAIFFEKDNNHKRNNLSNYINNCSQSQKDNLIYKIKEHIKTFSPSELKDSNDRLDYAILLATQDEQLLAKYLTELLQKGIIKGQHEARELIKILLSNKEELKKSENKIFKSTNNLNQTQVAISLLPPPPPPSDILLTSPNAQSVIDMDKLKTLYPKLHDVYNDFNLVYNVSQTSDTSDDNKKKFSNVLDQLNDPTSWTLKSTGIINKNNAESLVNKHDANINSESKFKSTKNLLDELTNANLERNTVNNRINELIANPEQLSYQEKIDFILITYKDSKDLDGKKADFKKIIASKEKDLKSSILSELKIEDLVQDKNLASKDLINLVHDMDQEILKKSLESKVIIEKNNLDKLKSPNNLDDEIKEIYSSLSGNKISEEGFKKLISRVNILGILKTFEDSYEEADKKNNVIKKKVELQFDESGIPKAPPPPPLPIGTGNPISNYTKNEVSFKELISQKTAVKARFKKNDITPRISFSTKREEVLAKIGISENVMQDIKYILETQSINVSKAKTNSASDYNFKSNIAQKYTASRLVETKGNQLQINENAGLSPSEKLEKIVKTEAAIKYLDMYQGQQDEHFIEGLSTADENFIGPRTEVGQKIYDELTKINEEKFLEAANDQEFIKYIENSNNKNEKEIIKLLSNKKNIALSDPACESEEKSNDNQEIKPQKVELREPKQQQYSSQGEEQGHEQKVQKHQNVPSMYETADATYRNDEQHNQCEEEEGDKLLKNVPPIFEKEEVEAESKQEKEQSRDQVQENDQHQEQNTNCSQKKEANTQQENTNTAQFYALHMNDSAEEVLPIEESKDKQLQESCDDEPEKSDDEGCQNKIDAENDQVTEIIAASSNLDEPKSQEVTDEDRKNTAVVASLLNTITNSKIYKYFHDLVVNNRIIISAGDEDVTINRGVWISGLYGVSSQGAWKSIPKYQGRTAGVTIGADTEVGDSSDVIGMAYSRIESHFKYNKKLGKTALNGHIFSAYGLKELPKNFSLQAIASYGYNYVKNKITNANNVIGKYKNNNFNFEGLLSYKYRTQYNISLIPTIGLKYGYSRNGNYKENNNIQNLTIQKKSNQLLEGSVGGKVMFRPIKLGNDITLTPSIHGDIESHFYNKNAKIRANAVFKEQIIEELITLPKQPKIGYNIGSNILVTRKNINMLLEYNYYTHKKYQSHQGLIKLKVNL